MASIGCIHTGAKRLARAIGVAALCMLAALALPGCMQDGTAAETGDRTFEESRVYDLTQNEPEPPETPEEALQRCVQEKLSEMSIRQKAAQLFVVRPEALANSDVLTQPNDALAEAFDLHPVGGIVFFQQNLIDTKQTENLLATCKQYSVDAVGLPLFTCVDEEGGTVARIGRNEGFDAADVGNMADIGATGDPENAREAALAIGSYLTELGFNVDFAPDADITNNPESATMTKRSFGSDASLVSSMVKAQVEGFEESGILCTAKHFPGIGGALGDSHVDSIHSDKTLSDMEDEELAPFKAAIESGVPFVMVGHLSLPAVTGDAAPASLSQAVITDILRNHLGFEKIIITDSLGMGAINEVYAPDEAAVLALEAGADMVLMPADFPAAYQGVLDAIESGRLSESRIDESIVRILSAKLSLPETESSAP